MLEQNPFSLYDFLGYFVPGSVFIFMIYFLDISESKTFEIRNVLYCLPEVNIGGALFFILAAYISGHILSYLSSITIEWFANMLFGYPSKYILGTTINYSAERIIKIIVSTCLFPPFLVIVIFRLFRFRFLYKEVDGFLKQSIERKIKVLLKRILKLDYQSYSTMNSVNPVDIHRVITHYVFDNSKQHQQKMVNYVSLYGLLRTLCLIFGMFGSSLILLKFKEPNFFCYYGCAFILSVICFMAFVKFYRRYTLEGFMLLITMDFRKRN
ncbi:hypothetical protein Q765_13060 [Flavobacterium rivuli WB 3.3-2 = DSM 21788]|uniref:Uncharacterized protein n=1 Tax=Flavobacterium rivuli WB 3.3-2 = DSM 21788 TaxID=1121895 RepID=A0A0A2M022_9FLAO|nr:hypothetical protein Q765_13060 [Flavobacterium rivuli WB 3.3-2 = DSM 21788]